jgi:hypothetical protein
MPTVRFPYVQAVASDPTSLMPRVPVTLTLGAINVDALGLVDSGATVNVLPYELGVQLGASWDDHTIRLSLSGNLARAEARAIRLKAKVGSFEPVDLLFAWTQFPGAPLILGQMNFFLEFNVCFFRAESAFELSKL